MGSHLHLTMGNEQSHAGGYGYIEKQMSNATGKDVSTLQNFYSDFQKECPNGQLSPQKFTELCEKVLGSSKAAEFKSKAFGRFDKHNNGSINFRDFLMVIHLTSNGSPLDKLKTLFSLFDQDGNGVIDAEEIQSVLTEVYEMLNEDCFKKQKVFRQSSLMFSMMD